MTSIPLLAWGGAGFILLAAVWLAVVWRRRHGDSAPPPIAPKLPAADILVTFARSGKRVPWQPASGTLLELAEAHGITLNAACRAGICGSCQTPLGAGEVSYLPAPQHHPEPGTCLPCVCTPKTSLTLDA
jgi:uncharacterized protein